MNAVVPILLAVLSNEKVIDFVVEMLSRLAKKRDNDIDTEYVEAQKESLQIRMRGQRSKLGDNIFLPDADVEQIKRKRTRRPGT